MRIDRLEDDDLEADNHVLRVENDEDQVEFVISISDSRSCRPSQKPGRGEEGFCFDDNSPGKITDDDRIAGKAKEILIESCLKMSSTLLGTRFGAKFKTNFALFVIF